MKKETMQKDQAEELRHLVDEIEDNKDTEVSSTILERETDKREIDILNLPPRKEVHTTIERTKLRISKPFIRIIFVIIILIAILIVSYYFM
ncbi:hypothetical protein CV093_11300 [Oceanobacillus sp. 143]|uniref:Uncharacterized protein n=1 Tax=Oceanobacillus zhaokaii TaxID=2052660 RepID=A0A345PH88_9BACI|nr:hypothetical protein [Oceanobacillus zhaokaii]AXI09368.1 hypothetical protein CUC15_10745 [Oceanobacillus zhaokaii]QGS68831.1 hypothetical protein CV093_11300 [Oceanobacillus sp. 143]